MSYFTWWQKLWFRVAALNRHGVHSPFVYDFVEQLLNGHYSPGAGLPQWPDPETSWSELVLRMAWYYGCSTIEVNDRLVELPAAEIAAAGIRFCKIIVINDLAGGLPAVMVPGLGLEDTILVIANPYKDKANAALWADLRMQQGVTLALDMFDAGLLFFRKEFLVPQYFRLRH